ncbi:hypothetical protein CYY_008582 [Polysphondylium violaceum]|uniref:EGF-like domain-containing protein n=1 Tax=Polysphondylium violaceum TaxID=133409 RepID=A0A8J4PMT7_9MYCE|nr:hypothetical protein CYY_008582 [Polysphondylium violaceum]
MQFIFKSGIVKQGGECVYESNTSTQSSGDSIRSIQMMLNGETLIGTFSDRIVLVSNQSKSTMSNNIGLYVCFLNLFILCVVGAPVINKIVPSWGELKGTVTIQGSGFGASPTVQANGQYNCITSYVSDTLIKCALTTTISPTPDTANFVVIANFAGSNSVAYGVVFYSFSGQNNNIFTINGDFLNIPNKSPGMILVKNVAETLTIAVSYSRNVLSFPLDKSIVEDGQFNLIDDTTNGVVLHLTPQFSPVVNEVIYFAKRIVIDGYLFTASTAVTTSVSDACTDPAWTPVGFACTPIPSFFKSTALNYKITQNGLTTTMTYNLRDLSSFLNDPNSDTATLFVQNYNPGAGVITIGGFTLIPFSPTSITNVGLPGGTHFNIQYPPNAQCGDAFISGDPNFQYPRISTSISACPTPVIQNSLQYPNNNNNYYLAFQGKFLNNYFSETQTQAMTYTILYGDGTTAPCDFVNQEITNSIYTTTCQIPAPVSPSAFKLTATTNTLASSTYYVGYQPIVNTITKTDYMIPGFVTITGVGFSSFDLIVAIGGSVCANPTVSDEGRQINCEFASDVPVIDFNDPLEVKVSVNSVDIGVNSIFLYNRPTPIISKTTPLSYNTTGQITISGTFLYSNALSVKIASYPCDNPVSNEDGESITCNLNSIITVVDINVPLEVLVTIEGTYIAKDDVFYFVLEHPTIISATSTVYGVSGMVTITGTNIFPFGLAVQIGGSPCTTIIVTENPNTVTCQFGSGVPITDINSPLTVIVSMNTIYKASAPAFFYTLQNPTVSSATSVVYGTPGIVTITGTLFYNFGLVVTIGGSTCGTPLASQDTKEVTCIFNSDVQVLDLATPLEVSVTMNSIYNAKNSVFLYSDPAPVSIISSTSTVYGKTGTVTITGTSFLNFDLVVSIGGSACLNAIASQDHKEITCNFKSDVTLTDINTSLQIIVAYEPNFTTQNSVFQYVLENPIITSSTSTLYGTAEKVTISGSMFFNFDLTVSIGGSTCLNAVASQDNKEITCDFKSDVQVPNTKTPLEVLISMDSMKYISKSSVFYYIEPIQVLVSSSTSTKYGIPGTVTITGNNFFNDKLVVKIGGSNCTEAVASQDTKQLTCQFKSDVEAAYNTALDVYVGIKSRFNTTEPVFLYLRPDKSCPIGSNGQECSGHGTCNQQFACDCIKGWASSDCSIGDNGGGTVIPDPNVNPNDTSSTIITPSGTMFDVGIVLINEMDKDNNVVQSYNITSINWNNVTKQQNEYMYTTLLQNDNKGFNSTLNVKLTFNNLDERVYYNFAGDIIPILPKSIKYQVELQNYTFSSSINTMQFIFKSGIAQEGGECVYKSNTSTQSSGDSIRSIQMMLNGETLIGTFSDRIVLDNRPSYNQVSKLTDSQITQYQLNSQVLYVSITTSSFKKDVVVDPNFGVLVTSTPDDKNQCKKKFAAWKIALIVVFGSVGVALVVGTVMLIKKRAVVKEFNAKLKALNNNNQS